MTDPELIEKKLAALKTYLHELRTLCRVERLRDDVRERRFIEHTLLQAIQSAIDVASHVVSDERLGEPSTQKELFETLGRRGVLEVGLSERLAGMVGFRNILVHNYVRLDLDALENVLANRLGDLDDFVAAIFRRLPERM
jgi:uncharacterized protein YutE (UPF0331/DUF86 family)